LSFDLERALDLLRLGCGNPGAEFRDGQAAAIEHVVEGRGRLLVVQKTGWGKSFVYFIATKLLRESGQGPTLLVSPLLSLMRNQLAAAERMGVRAETINSDNATSWSKIEARLANDDIDVLLISPERLGNEHFVQEVLAPIAGRIALLVVDEAHCISDWGHDFRPHYRLLERIVRGLPRTMRVLATTATANNRVMADLQSVLGPNLEISRGDLHRPTLALQTIRLAGQVERLAWLAGTVPEIEGSGIIYTLTVRDAEMVAAWLQSRGISALAYTGQSDGRADLEQSLLDNRVKALVATTALGMGFDKSDLAFVVHYQTPGSVVAYYQQVGRAGRGTSIAHGVLMCGEEDSAINAYFIESAFPTRADVEALLGALANAPAGLSVPELMAHVNLSKSRIDKAIALLALESPAPLVKVGTRWQLTAFELSPAFWERAERLTALRREEQAQMQAYTALDKGHMAFLIAALDGDFAAGDLAQPVDVLLSDAVDPALVQAAVVFLRRTNLPIEPRKQWPPGGLASVHGRLTAAVQARPGRALCVSGDSGWGTLVRDGRYRDGHFDDALVTACVELMQQWRPEPAPTWLTCVPSLRHPRLVPDFAERLATALDLPFHDVLGTTTPRAEQRTLANSAQQARNVDGTMEVSLTPLPSGPVLLVDDIVGSRWTLTVAAWLLRQAGSAEVWPLALALSGNDE